MNSCLIILLSLLSISLRAGTLGPIKQKNETVTPEGLLILNAIRKDAGMSEWVSENEVEKIIEHAPQYENYEEEVEIKKEVKTKNKTQGESAVERLKRLNREKIQQLQSKDENNSVPQMEKLDLKNMSMKDLKIHNRKQLKQWKNQVQKTYAKWKAARQEYLDKIADYVDGLVPEDTFANEKTTENAQKTFEESKKKLQSFLNDQNSYTVSVEKIKSKVQKKKLVKEGSTEKVKVKQTNPKNFKIIDSAFNVPIRNQGRRPTCASFAAVRAIEILMAQNGKQADLSEQYFYWASKPECQSRKCNSYGSWVVSGFKHSQNSPGLDIPTESSCSYNIFPKEGNQTQIPLENGCRDQGIVKVVDYSYAKTMSQVLDALNKNKPVIGGMKLTPQFYDNDGIVGIHKNSDRVNLDNHAAGHAMLIVGHMSLPSSMHSTEGNYCLMIANSWGSGWGKGGHACVTENWLKANKLRNDFVIVEKIRI